MIAALSNRIQPHSEDSRQRDGRKYRDVWTIDNVALSAANRGRDTSDVCDSSTSCVEVPPDEQNTLASVVTDREDWVVDEGESRWIRNTFRQCVVQFCWK